MLTRTFGMEASQPRKSCVPDVMQLTDEQKQPLLQVRPPQPAEVVRNIVATVAGPGSGKTTMQEHIASELHRAGHQQVLKLFFNRQAADDGRARLIKKSLRGVVECCTTHSAALRFGRRSMGENCAERCCDESRLQAIIETEMADKIASWHGERPEQAPPAEREQARANAARATKLVAFWIFKTLLNFLSSKETEAQLAAPPSTGPGAFDGLTYFQARTYHRQRLPRCPRPEAGGWYRQRAHELWRRMCAEPAFPLVHDAYLKFAQLHGLALTGFTAILIDEAQDLTSCQLDLFVRQQTHADIFVVGDMAQSLYSWRLAAPRELASLVRFRTRTPLSSRLCSLRPALASRACRRACRRRMGRGFTAFTAS